MIAYKFLRPDGSGVFTRFAWPLPGREPGAWVEAPVVACRSGVHACRAEDLPLWLGQDLYEIELGGRIVAERMKVVAARGRLLRRIGAWDEAARAAYTQDCVARAHALAADLPDWDAAVEPASAGGPAAIGFIAARIAEERDGPAAYHAERAHQVAWLSARLAL